MRFGDFKAAEDTNPAYRRIKELGLESNVVDIETYGFTVVPAEKVTSRDFFERVRDTVLRIARERSGVDLQLDRNGSVGRNPSSSKQGSQFLLFCLFMEDPILEKWLMNPAMYTLADYLMRGKQQLSNLASFYSAPVTPRELRRCKSSSSGGSVVPCKCLRRAVDR